MLQSTPPIPLGLYPTLLGDSWWKLDDAVRRLHDSTRTICAVGKFRVRHGSNRLARVLAWLARLPADAEAANVQLVVTSRSDTEDWRRTFDGRPLVTAQWSRPGGLLVERKGLAELWFRIEAIDGALNYRTEGAALALGPLRLRLPRWLSPRVIAWERPAGKNDQIDVFVEVNIPILGRLISYEGRLTRTEAPA